MKKIAINGFGRIERAALKIMMESPELEVVAINGDLVKVMAWYDNEWGFTNQMIRQVRAL